MAGVEWPTERPAAIQKTVEILDKATTGKGAERVFTKDRFLNFVRDQFADKAAENYRLGVPEGVQEWLLKIKEGKRSVCLAEELLSLLENDPLYGETLVQGVRKTIEERGMCGGEGVIVAPESAVATYPEGYRKPVTPLEFQTGRTPTEITPARSEPPAKEPAEPAPAKEADPAAVPDPKSAPVTDRSVCETRCPSPPPEHIGAFPTKTGINVTVVKQTEGGSPKFPKGKMWILAEGVHPDDFAAGALDVKGIIPQLDPDEHVVDGVKIPNSMVYGPEYYTKGPWKGRLKSQYHYFRVKIKILTEWHRIQAVGKYTVTYEEGHVTKISFSLTSAVTPENAPTIKTIKKGGKEVKIRAYHPGALPLELDTVHYWIGPHTTGGNKVQGTIAYYDLEFDLPPQLKREKRTVYNEAVKGAVGSIPGDFEKVADYIGKRTDPKVNFSVLSTAVKER